MYKGGSFTFSFNINTNYPHEPPKVKCVPKVSQISRNFCSLPELIHVPAVQIYHPNVDLEGNVCLNILREDWKPVLNLNSVMVGLQYLFLEPNADDPLNKGVQSCTIHYFCTLLIPYFPPRRRRRSPARPQPFYVQREDRDAGRTRQE
jgi:ubiquitin-protein ligase